MFKVPEKYRELEHSDSSDGNNGYFIIPRAKDRDTLIILASDGLGWEHVSVSKRYECPSWDDMCFVKTLFWSDPEDVVIQYHPARSNYINNHPYCLHLWKPIGQAIICPPDILVGIK